ncbi:hypothetical protein HAZT_HAZT004479 [Hyalella azteca]|uniref:Ig-like domain-containing protein n=1 Tax=Hyalella azteca TaxID=294128 RepID=A0A6A0H6X5_HYAAZ|nr:hypothetical protein HAZT_HAZT004479 [Hyalella azteca]
MLSRESVLKEGSIRTRPCEPPPEVVWRLGSHVVDSSWEWPRPGLATNTLTIPELQREHLHASLVCEAHNTNLTIPVTTIVTIEMNRELQVTV